jgi:hypothetical protein
MTAKRLQHHAVAQLELSVVAPKVHTVSTTSDLLLLLLLLLQVTLLCKSGAAPDHPLHPAYPEGEYLTALTYRVV